MNTPVDVKIVEKNIRNCGICDVSKSSIREMVRLVNDIEKDSNVKFFRMEMGVRD